MPLLSPDLSAVAVASFAPVRTRWLWPSLVLTTWLCALLTVLPAHAALGASPPTWQGRSAQQASAVGLASPVALAWVKHVLLTGDHKGLPFAVVDKQAAQMVLVDAKGQLAGVAPALLGRRTGDHSLPGVGERTQTRTLRPEDLTTPAGRFTAASGRNHTGELVIWLDNELALSVHRVRPGPAQARRAAALAQLSPGQRRLSEGCVVVAGAFFDQVVAPLLGQGRSVVYVLPEVDAGQGPGRLPQDLHARHHLEQR